MFKNQHAQEETARNEAPCYVEVARKLKERTDKKADRSHADPGLASTTPACQEPTAVTEGTPAPPASSPAA